MQAETGLVRQTYPPIEYGQVCNELTLSRASVRPQLGVFFLAEQRVIADTVHGPPFRFSLVQSFEASRGNKVLQGRGPKGNVFVVVPFCADTRYKDDQQGDAGHPVTFATRRETRVR